jgi:hypothetical protein
MVRDERYWRFALTGDGGAVLALPQGLFRLDLDSGALHLLAPPPFDPALFRFNEGACDANGRFWTGVIFDPLKGWASGQPGKIESFTFVEDLRGNRPPPSCIPAHPAAATPQPSSCRTAPAADTCARTMVESDI